VAIEEHADDAAAHDAVKGLVMWLRRPVADDLVTLDAALDAQSALVQWPAAEAAAMRGVAILQALGQGRPAP
jgi:hypothetical protein